jgi:uncharacterized BrkB/YihY/UPF0761 family membrane protein
MTVSLGRYWLIFAGSYVGVMVLVNILIHGFDLDLGSSANMTMLFAAGYISATKFVTDHKRAPDADEKRKLVWGSLSIAVLISVVAVGLLLLIVGENVSTGLTQLLGGLPTIAWMIIIAVVLLLHYFILSLMYGWAARNYAEKVIAKRAR